MRVGLVVLVLVVTGAGESWATCARWQDVLSPQRGTLPPDPSFYFFTRGWNLPWFLVDGRPTTYRRTHLGVLDDGYDDIAIWRLDVQATGQKLMVGHVDFAVYDQEVVREYEIDPAWRRPAEAMHVDVEVSRHSWTCSREEALTLLPSVAAPAYRVEWARTKLDFDRGHRAALVWPTSTGMFFAGSEQPPRIGLGELDCFITSFPGNALGVYWEVTPLFADGPTPYVPPPPPAPTPEDSPVEGYLLIAVGILVLLVRRRR
jgi:hypothetical protein